MNTISSHHIPTEVTRVTKTLSEAGFEAYLVGGCVRDMLLDKKPKDWDVTTNATPEQIQELFEHTFYENDYGTVGVVYDDAEDPTHEVIEVTPYRTESTYTDRRRPDAVTFSDNLEDDLKRRDFTVNALAYDVTRETLVDVYSGVDDLKKGLIRAVGDPHERFNEDALRLLRAVRISAEHNFAIEEHTRDALIANAHHLAQVSHERIRDEFNRIIDSPHPMVALEMVRLFGLIPHIIPELEELWGIEQGGIHAFDVWEHCLRSLQAGADKNYPFHVKLAALFHDIGKPRTRRKGTKKAYTFYGHEVVGAKMTKQIMQRLSYSKDLVTRVTTLVRWHMFFSDPDEISHTAIRRLLRNIGEENIEDIIHLRICDRVGTGRPKEEPYRLRKYQAMIEEVLADPVSVGQLKINGDILQETLHMKPGPVIGHVLHALLEEVLTDPSLNTEEYLMKQAKHLLQLSPDELKERADAGKQSREAADEAQKAEIRNKYHVK